MKLVKNIKKNVYKGILRLMPIICVDLVVRRGKKVLLVKRSNSPAKNKWWLPGGRIYKGETINQAARRKAREEVGLNCRVKKILGVEETYFIKKDDMKFDIHTINITVELSIVEKKMPIIDKDHSDYVWAENNSYSFHPSIQRIFKGLGLHYNHNIV